MQLVMFVYSITIIPIRVGIEASRGKGKRVKRLNCAIGIAATKAIKNNVFGLLTVTNAVAVVVRSPLKRIADVVM